MTVFLDWRFLNETKRSKKPKRFYRFVSFYQTVASYRATRSRIAFLRTR